MTSNIPEISTWAELLHFVHVSLCRHENLLEDQFDLRTTWLRRDDAICGAQLTLQGPRNVRLGAVWAGDQNAVFLYDARGERFAKQRLAQKIELPAEVNSGLRAKAG